MAAHDYVWETMYEGPGYFNFKYEPPMGMFPHSVEGSLVDINDDQYADQFGALPTIKEIIEEVDVLAPVSTDRVTTPQ